MPESMRKVAAENEVQEVGKAMEFARNNRGIYGFLLDNADPDKDYHQLLYLKEKGWLPAELQPLLRRYANVIETNPQMVKP
jgi:hypothetical protein